MTKSETTNANPKAQVKFFDKFTKTLFITMVVLLLIIFASAKFMAANNMEAGGTDDTVNTLASDVTKTEHHPFVELPGDSQVAAFSVANFFAGLIVGHNAERLFGKKKEGLEPGNTEKAD